MKLNTAVALEAPVTHEGGKAERQSPKLELERAVATCLLWEDTFYEKGSEIATRIAELVRKVTFAEVGEIALKARNDWRLRHVPLFLVAEMARKRGEHKGPIIGIEMIGSTLAQVIQRPDEMAEFLAIYWRDGAKLTKQGPLSKQVKRGLAMAFRKFDAYQLGKWNRDGKIKLRDVLFLCHARAKDEEQEALWKTLIDGTLPVPDTWEVALSGGADKKETFARLLLEGRLGIMALLMNLRNMVQAGVDLGLIGGALLRKAPGSKALPFRFLTAARHAPALAGDLGEAMLAALADQPKFSGTTFIVVDVSGSMEAVLSSKGETTRMDAASGLAVMVREICERARVFTFSNALVEVPTHRGLGLVEAIKTSQDHGGTYLANAIARLPAGADRVIVVTDGQAHDGLGVLIGPKSYLINVAPYKPGLDTTGGWVRINGFSERILDWIRFEEEESKVST